MTTAQASDEWFDQRAEEQDLPEAVNKQPDGQATVQPVEQKAEKPASLNEGQKFVQQDEQLPDYLETSKNCM